MPTMTLIITERRTETPESKSDETHDVGSMLQRWEAASGPVLECARQDIPLRRRLRREKAAIRNHSADPDCHVASRSTRLHRAHWSRLARVPRAPASTSPLHRYFFDPLVHEQCSKRRNVCYICQSKCWQRSWSGRGSCTACGTVSTATEAMAESAEICRIIASTIKTARDTGRCYDPTRTKLICTPTRGIR